MEATIIAALRCFSFICITAFRAEGIFYHIHYYRLNADFRPNDIPDKSGLFRETDNGCFPFDSFCPIYEMIQSGDSRCPRNENK